MTNTMNQRKRIVLVCEKDDDEEFLCCRIVRPGFQQVAGDNRVTDEEKGSESFETVQDEQNPKSDQESGEEESPPPF